MTAVYYFSGTGHSKAIAEHIAEELCCPLIDIERASEPHCTTAAVVFPVYSDNIPAPVRAFLPGLDCKNTALIASYGRMSHGNVLTQAARFCRGQIICGAYIPTGHTYLGQTAEFDRQALEPVIERIRMPKPASLPREKASLLGRIFPEARARMAVKLHRNDRCTGCRVCDGVCPMGSMSAGIPGKDCLRCLRCVKECPEHALSASYLPVLKAYLSGTRQNDTIIYL